MNLITPEELEQSRNEFRQMVEHHFKNNPDTIPTALIAVTFTGDIKVISKLPPAYMQPLLQALGRPEGPDKKEVNLSPTQQN